MRFSLFEKSNARDLKGYNAKKQEKETVFMDFVSLYPSSGFNAYLPHAGFLEWEPQKVDEYFQLMKTKGIWREWCETHAFKKQGLHYGLVLVVDISIPERYHTYFDSFCPVPEYRSVTESMSSDWQKRILKELGKKPEKDSKRQLLTILPKQKAILDFRYLRWCLSHDLTLTKIHTIKCNPIYLIS